MTKDLERKDDLVYTPAEVANIGIESAKRITGYAEYGLPLGIEGIDGYFAPLMPGQMGVVIGQTSHWKSGFMSFLSETSARGLAATTKRNQKAPAVIFISTEDFIEEQAYVSMARNSAEAVRGLSSGQIHDLPALEKTAIDIAGIPIYRIGMSFARPSVFYEQLYLSNLIRSVELIAQKRDIRGIFVDYLQALPIDPEVAKAEISQHRRLQVRQDMFRLKQACAYYKAPVWVAVQAKQNMSTSAQHLKIPGIYDGEESSSIAQRTDRGIGLWLPKMHYLPGSTIRLGGREITVTEDMLLLKVLKQRGAFPSGRVWLCRLDYDHGIIRVDNEVLSQVPF